MKRKVYIILALLLAALLIIVTIQNSQQVDIKLLGWKTSASLILVIFLSFLAGVIFNLLLMIPRRKKDKVQKTKPGE